MRLVHQLAALAALAVCSAPALAGSYSAWAYDKGHDRYYCSYSYPAAGGGTSYQTVLYYPKGARTNYYYWANNKGDIWGRCCCQGHADYSPKVMQWAHISDGKWVNDKSGFCPTPKDAPKTEVIDKIPDPPKPAPEVVKDVEKIPDPPTDKIAEP